MAAELAREAHTRVEKPLASLRRLRRGRNPYRAVPVEQLPVVILEPIHPATSGERPSAVHPHRFQVAARVALMIVKAGQGRGTSVGLLAVPNPHIVRISTGDQQEPRAQGQIPVCRRAQLVVGTIDSFVGISPQR